MPANLRNFTVVEGLTLDFIKASLTETPTYFIFEPIDYARVIIDLFLILEPNCSVNISKKFNSADNFVQEEQPLTSQGLIKVENLPLGMYKFENVVGAIKCQVRLRTS